jgi:hypothetical protein
MGDYRTPAQEAEDAQHRARIQPILNQARDNGASLFAAMELGEPAEVVETWVDRLWDGLRDQLNDEDRLLAIVMLIQSQALRAARRLTSGSEVS